MENIILLRIAKFFLQHPYREVYLRELAKALKLSPFATKRYLDLLLKNNLVEEERKANLRYFKANSSSLFYKHLKMAMTLKEIEESGLITFLQETIPNTSSIILFGSTAQGDDTEESDIDLVVIGKKISPPLGRFREVIQRDINLHIFSWPEWKKKAEEDEPFYNEVILHSIVLYGELPLAK